MGRLFRHEELQINWILHKFDEKTPLYRLIRFSRCSTVSPMFFPLKILKMKYFVNLDTMFVI